MMKTRIPVTSLGVAMLMAFVPPTVHAQDARVPKPDFSEMEKDYEVIKWTYESSGYIRLVIKPKHDGPHDSKYGFDFFDTDGVKVDGPKIIFNNGFSTPAGQVEKGEAYAPDEAGMRKVKAVVVYKVLSDGTEVGPKPQPIVEPVVAPKQNSSVAPATSGSALVNKPSATTSSSGKATGGCSFEKQAASSPKMAFSQSLIKSLIYERYSFETNIGGFSSPAAIGVRFINIKLLGSYKNTVKVVPGRGAQRKHDGAPVNATVHRFHAKYIVCRKYSDSTRSTQYESDFACFKDKNGGWDCPVDSVPQVKDLE